MLLELSLSSVAVVLHLVVIPAGTYFCRLSGVAGLPRGVVVTL